MHLQTCFVSCKSTQEREINFKTFVHLIIIQKIYTQSTSSNMRVSPQIGYSKHIIILSMTSVCSIVPQHFLVPVASVPFSCCSASLLTHRRCSGVDEAQTANMLGNQCCSPGFSINKSLMKVILAQLTAQQDSKKHNQITESM